MKSKGVFQLYPLVPLVSCLILGIVAGRLMAMYVEALVWIAVLLLSVVVSFLLRKHPLAQSRSLLLSSFLLGCALISITERKSRAVFPDAAMQYEAVVVSEPVDRGKILRFDMIVVSDPMRGRTVRASLLKDTIEQHYRHLTMCDGIVAYSKFQPPSNYKESNFDYVTYLKVHDIPAVTFIYHRDWQKARISTSVLSAWQRTRLSFLRLRHQLIERYRCLGLSGQDFAVAAAMTLGHKSELSDELREAYSKAGVSHVLALSGMHLSVIYMLLSFLFLGRRFVLLREAILLSAIWAYVFMVGMPLSVVRSALMITVYSLVAVTGRDRMSLNTLAFAAICILVANPFSLYDIGFRLSFLSVASILILHPLVSTLVPLPFQQRHPLFRWLWQLIVMSCSAQLATAPLVAYYFGRLPVYFLLSNLVAIPVVTVILYLSVLMLALFFIPAVQQMIAFLLMSVVARLNTFLLWVASLPGASVDNIRLNTIQLLLAYVIIIALCLVCRIVFGRRKHSA